MGTILPKLEKNFRKSSWGPFCPCYREITVGRAVGDHFAHVREEITLGRAVGDHFAHAREEL